MKKFIKENKFNIIILTCYAVVTFIILLFHESWRDEAQSWLIARDLNLIDIIKQMRYEGHPFLWHIILVPFAKLGLPYATIKIVSWLITIISVWLILTKAPFNKHIKILILFTMPFLYLYPVIARSYCLVPLAITLISIFYNKRHEKPIQYVLSILMLVSTHVIMYGMVAILLLLFYWEELIINRKTNCKEEKKKVWISLLIIILGTIIIVTPIALSVISNTDVNASSALENGSFLNILTKADITLQTIIYSSFNIQYIWSASLIISILLIMYFYELKYYKKNALILFCSIGFQLLIYIFLYYCSEQRAATINIMIMFIAWIQLEKINENKYMKAIQTLLIGVIVLNIMGSVCVVYDELVYNYSAAEQTAEYINKNDEKNVYICTEMPLSSSIIPYANRNMFWSPQTQDYFTYVSWDEKYQAKYSLEELKEIINKNFPKEQKLYLIYPYNWNKEIVEELVNNGSLIEKFRSDGAKKERYIIFEITDTFRK